MYASKLLLELRNWLNDVSFAEVTGERGRPKNRNPA
jgi:hypothetical protein